MSAASGSIPTLLPPLPCYCKQGDCVCLIISYIEEVLYSGILLWACCPIGTGALEMQQKQEAKLPGQRIIPQQSNFQFPH